MAKGHKNQVKVYANNIRQAFIKIKKWNTLESNSLSPMESPLWVQAPATWYHPRGGLWQRNGVAT